MAGIYILNEGVDAMNKSWRVRVDILINDSKHWTDPSPTVNLN